MLYNIMHLLYGEDFEYKGSSLKQGSGKRSPPEALQCLIIITPKSVYMGAVLRL